MKKAVQRRTSQMCREVQRAKPYPLAIRWREGSIDCDLPVTVGAGFRRTNAILATSYEFLKTSTRSRSSDWQQRAKVED